MELEKLQKLQTLRSIETGAQASTRWASHQRRSEHSVLFWHTLEGMSSSTICARHMQGPVWASPTRRWTAANQGEVGSGLSSTTSYQKAALSFCKYLRTGRGLTAEGGFRWRTQGCKHAGRRKGPQMHCALSSSVLEREACMTERMSRSSRELEMRFLGRSLREELGSLRLPIGSSVGVKPQRRSRNASTVCWAVLEGDSNESNTEPGGTSADSQEDKAPEKEENATEKLLRELKEVRGV
jgi:hypothetical protein